MKNRFITESNTSFSSEETRQAKTVEFQKGKLLDYAETSLNLRNTENTKSAYS